jgi:hypothetical protein
VDSDIRIAQEIATNVAIRLQSWESFIQGIHKVGARDELIRTFPVKKLSRFTSPFFNTWTNEVILIAKQN